MEYLRKVSWFQPILVALNAAAGLIVSGKENDYKNAFDKVTKHLKSGKVFEHLTKLQSN